ncbi:MAG: hypothetical protein IK115_00065 [Lachnospiraceae bacterium]|nr:hypothetical protein [Lachnospiraceae bacterium]
MRIDCMDKLDRLNFYSTMHSNLVKWWFVNMTEPEEEAEETEEEEYYDADAAAEELLADALGEGSDEPENDDPLFTHTDSRGYGYGLDGSDLSIPQAEDVFSEEAGMDPEAAAVAMEIFQRLQAEAAADEAAKQAEIEAAKAAQG